LALVSGCATTAERVENIFENMREQPSYRPLEPSQFFPDGSSARPLPPGAIPRRAFAARDPYYTGRAGGELVSSIPFTVTQEVVERGRERYDIFCAPCHAVDGQGDTVVVQRGFPAPPSLRDERLRTVPDGHIYEVISNGLKAMPPYAGQILPGDRWAIVAYVRELQANPPAGQEDQAPEPTQ
jgi:mono/diheme cytochrome c family protein